MASASEDLFAAIDAGDVGSRPGDAGRGSVLAMARAIAGVSALLPRPVSPRPGARRGRQGSGRLARCLRGARRSATSTGSRSSSQPTRTDGTPERRRVHGVLHLAAFFGQDDAVRLLLARGADPDAPGTGWMTGTPLNAAASARRATVVALLLEAGADPDAVQRGGWTPLHSAAHNGDRSDGRSSCSPIGADPARGRRRRPVGRRHGRRER